MKNKIKLTICLLLCMLLLTACTNDQTSSPQTDADDEYVLLIGFSDPESDEYSYAAIDKNTGSFAEGREAIAGFIEQYLAISKSDSISSISTDGRHIVANWPSNNNERTIDVYEDLELIFSNTVNTEEFYFISEMDYAIPLGDYATQLTSLLGSGYGFSYPGANAMIDLNATKDIFPDKANEQGTMYLVDEIDYNPEVSTYSIYSYPEHELLNSFERLASEEPIWSDSNYINQLVDENRLIYTVRDGNSYTSTTYLLDWNNNTEVELGKNLLTPRVSPDGKHLAYESEDATAPGIYIIDLENDETHYFSVAENGSSHIIGWVKRSRLC